MKAIVRQESKNDWHVELYINSYDFVRCGAYIKEEYAQKRADAFNSALAFHVQSSLSSKIEQIKKTFTDRKVRPLDPVWVKNEILKILKGQ